MDIESVGIAFPSKIKKKIAQLAKFLDNNEHIQYALSNDGDTLYAKYDIKDFYDLADALADSLGKKEIKTLINYLISISAEIHEHLVKVERQYKTKTKDLTGAGGMVDWMVILGTVYGVQDMPNKLLASLINSYEFFIEKVVEQNNKNMEVSVSIGL